MCSGAPCCSPPAAMPPASRYRCFSSSVPCSPRMDIFLMCSRGVMLQGDRHSSADARTEAAAPKRGVRHSTVRTEQGMQVVSQISDGPASQSWTLQCSWVVVFSIQKLPVFGTMQMLPLLTLSCLVSLDPAMQEKSGCWKIAPAQKDVIKPKPLPSASGVSESSYLRRQVSMV